MIDIIQNFIIILIVILCVIWVGQHIDPGDPGSPA